MTIECHSSRENWRESRRVCFNISPVRDYSVLFATNGLIPRVAANTISHMGLMPEIDRAWVTIDNKLFLWDYVEGCATRNFALQASELILFSIVKR